MPASSVHIFPGDHPALATRVRSKLEARITELSGHVGAGLAQDWGDYKSRTGYIAGLMEAVLICEQAEKELNE